MKMRCCVIPCGQADVGSSQKQFLPFRGLILFYFINFASQAGRAEHAKCIIRGWEFNNKHLMTGPKGNSEFCFPETLSVPRDEAEGNIEVEGKQNSLFPEGRVIKCFVIPPNSK